MTDDPKADDDLPAFLDLKKRLPPKEYEAAIAKAREATERANRPARPSAAPKAEKPPAAPPKAAKGKVAKLPVPPPKSGRSVVAEKKQPEAVAKTPRTEDVQSIGKAPGQPPTSSKADQRKDYPMPTTSKKTATRGVTSPAPKQVQPADARAIAKAVKAKGKKTNGKSARTPVKGKTTAKKPAKREEGTPRAGTMTVEILKLAARKQGVSREELNTLTEWTGAPWKWNFSNPKGTGYCDRFGYKLAILTGKDGETRYHVTKR